MKTNQRTSFFLSAFCGLIFSGLILNACSPVPAVPKKDAPRGKNVPAKNAPESISGVSSAFSATLPDPKRPGKMLYELRGASGNIQSDAGGFHGDAASLWARLYQNGAASAVLTAPRALVKSIGKSVTVTGFGGVVVKSLTEPGTKMTADTVVWYASQNKMVATGHVFYRNGKTGGTLTGPRMVADTQVRSVFFTGGGHGTATF